MILFAEKPKRSTLIRTWFGGQSRGLAETTRTGVLGSWPDDDGRGEQKLIFDIVNLSPLQKQGLLLYGPE